jgi:hypothetical protein
MGYHEDAVHAVTAGQDHRYAVVRARCAREVVQCYLNGELAESQRPVDQQVTFVLPPLGDSDVVFLLGVDAADARTDYFRRAYPEDADHGNRITIYLFAGSGYRSADVATFYRGEAGEGEAARLLGRQRLFPGGRWCGGWGKAWGRHWGRGDYGRGWGYSWGRSWGYGAPRVQHRTGPLPPGTYPVKIVVADGAGNASAAATAAVTLNTYPRPSADLTVDAYDKDTDTLVLSWTASPDF